MKSLIKVVVVAAVMAVPAVSFAQDNPANPPLTRAEVRAQLIQLEQVGYDPATVSNQYPADIQAAEARVQQQNPPVQNPNVADNGSGPSMSGSSQWGSGWSPSGPGAKPIYFGH